jgi:hypothetical protein
VGDVLLAVTTILLVWLATLIVTALVIRSRLRRRNRVARQVPSSAPVHWLWSPSAPARLHRRLQTAVWTIDPASGTASVPEAAGTDGIRDDLVAHATAIDQYLVAVRRAPRRIRRSELRITDGHVGIVEDLCARVGGSPRVEPRTRWSTPWVAAPGRRVTAPWPLLDLRERVLHLEAARSEIERVDRGVYGEFWPITAPAQPASEVDTLTSVSSATLAAPLSSD